MNDLFRAEGVRQFRGNIFGFGEQKSAADFRIEPMNVGQKGQSAFSSPRFGIVDSRMEQAYEIRLFRIGVIGRSRQAGRFINSQEGVILEEDWDFPELVGAGRGEFDGGHFLGKVSVVSYTGYMSCIAVIGGPQ